MNHSKLSGPVKNDSVVYVWGEALNLEVIERKGHPKIIISGGNMIMYVRPDFSPGLASAGPTPTAKRQDFLDKWYRETLKKAAPPIITKWEKRLGVSVKKLYIRKMKTHWGSCNYRKHTLRLNSELVKRGAECLEYVIIHEMLHIIEKGHNKRFYCLLNQYFPDWKRIRKKLNSGL